MVDDLLLVGVGIGHAIGDMVGFLPDGGKVKGYPVKEMGWSFSFGPSYDSTELKNQPLAGSRGSGGRAQQPLAGGTRSSGYERGCRCSGIPNPAKPDRMD